MTRSPAFGRCTVRATAAAGLALALAAAVPPRGARACSSCGCIISSDWAAQGYVAGAGFHLDLRFDYFSQDQLRSGTSAVDRGSVTLPNDREIQQKTVNRNASLALDWSPSAEWGVTVLAPFFDRTHTTVAPGDTAVSASDFSELGDLKVVGRYQGFSPDHTTGVQIGLKVPTGSFHATFSGGPQRGTPLDRGLQPGTGTTDLLAGIYHYGALRGRWTYFAQVLLQQALDSREGFRPGTGVNVNVGVRYTGNPAVAPQIQLSVRAEKRESGAEADAANSGAVLVYVGPGVTVRVARGLLAYGFVQLPVYQNVNGLQLEARSTVTAGFQVRP